jgi:hypothetical protein
MTRLSRSQLLLSTLRVLLRPLVDLLVRNGVTFPEFAELLKSIYVDVADQEMTIPGKQQTQSRISLISGVHRKDVKRLLEVNRGDSEPVAQKQSFGSRVLGVWLGRSSYRNGDGSLKALPKTSANGIDFESLVASVTKDLRPRALLDDWLQQGVVHIDAEGSIVLDPDVFIPSQGFEDKLYYFGRNLRDHIAAGASNLQRSEQEPALFDRAVFYDGLSRNSMSELQSYANQFGTQSLEQLNQRALELAEQDDADDEHHHHGRITFGAYFYQENRDAI